MARTDDEPAADVSKIGNQDRSEAPDEAAGADQPRRSRRVQAVDHAIDVLEALAETPRGMTLSALAQQVELSKAAVHHLLVTLETRRIVVRDLELPRYRLGWALYELGMHVTRSVDLTRIARPFLDELAARTGESALLGIRDGVDVLYLDRGDAPSGFRMVATAGRRSPLYATASGKVLLAFSDDPALFDEVTRAGLARLTDSTITQVSTLRGELAEVRRRGYSTCWQEREVGLCSLAVPIRDYSGAVVASLAIAGPDSRLNVTTLNQHLAPLRHVGAAIGARLGDGAPSTDT